MWNRKKQQRADNTARTLSECQLSGSVKISWDIIRDLHTLGTRSKARSVQWNAALPEARDLLFNIITKESKLQSHKKSPEGSNGSGIHFLRESIYSF